MPESDSSEGPTPAKKSRRLLTVEKKLEIVAYAKSVSINAAGNKFKVGRNNIRDWKNNEEKLKKLW